MINARISRIPLLVAAVVLLVACAADGSDMRQQLSVLEERNHSGEQMLNDSLAEQLVDYFDRHGTANERMRARYILGRTYFDMGELPRALETYYTACECADTMAADCDHKTLSRIHAQSARIFNLQVQPRSHLLELRQAMRHARLANDTKQYIECYSQQADGYRQLHQIDSAIIVGEKAVQMYYRIGRKERGAAKLGPMILPLVEKHDVIKARDYVSIYERESGFFDKQGNIEQGREIYYYIKGQYYLSVYQVDSAEYLFRKELRLGKDLNNQIAGTKGLQEVYAYLGIPDSIVKYASLGYVLNDSAYSLSEMENIQRLSASYNYEHNKSLAIKEHHRAEQAFLLTAFTTTFLLTIILLGLYLFSAYKRRKNLEVLRYQKDKLDLEAAKAELEYLRSADQEATAEQISAKDEEIAYLEHKLQEARQVYERHIAKLESRIDNHPLIEILRNKANGNPSEEASLDDLRQLTSLVNELIPSFYTTFHQLHYSLNPTEYRVCMLVRVHFRPSEISRLTGMSDAHVANMKKRILRKLFNVEGTPKDLDSRVLGIK